MYLEIDEGFDTHPKTVRLCRVMGDVNAGQYLIRIWAWACRSAADGDISGMEAADIEAIARYKKADGKLFAALTERWSPKFGPWLDFSDGVMRIHGWEERQGAAIARMSKKAADMRSLRDRRRAERGDHVATTLPPRSGDVVTRPDQTRPDQSSPDQTSLQKGESPPVADAKIRPRTSHDLIHCLRVAIEREQPQNGFWNPGGSFSDKEAQDFLAGFQPLEAALPEIERRIALFAKDPAAAPWTVKKFADTYNGIGVIKRADGRIGPAPVAYPTLTR